MSNSSSGVWSVWVCACCGRRPPPTHLVSQPVSQSGDSCVLKFLLWKTFFYKDFCMNKTKLRLYVINEDFIISVDFFVPRMVWVSSSSLHWQGRGKTSRSVAPHTGRVFGCSDSFRNPKTRKFKNIFTKILLQWSFREWINVITLLHMKCYTKYDSGKPPKPASHQYLQHNKWNTARSLTYFSPPANVFFALAFETSTTIK